MTVELPHPVDMHLAAQNARDLDSLADVFAADALVRDEARDHRGLDAIRAWREESQAAFHYTAEALDASVDGDAVTARVRLTGDFPGSPADLIYTFVLAGDKIRSLEIT